jgi:hypothetical protein
MPYDNKQLAGYVLLQDAQGTAENDVAAPPEGQTLLYTTEQGLVLERHPTEGFAARQWFLDQPFLLSGNEPNALSDTPQSILAAPYIVPDDIDANFPTFYRIELGIVVENFSPDASSAGIWVQPFVDGDLAAPPALVPCDAASGQGGTTVTFFVTAFSPGHEIDVRAYVINPADNADAYAYLGLVKRELRLSGFGG